MKRANASLCKAPSPKPGHFLFTSESVNEGHPDKICDQVSDAILDACLTQDPDSKVACETCTKTGMIIVFGEITTKASVNYEEVVRNTVKDIGYDDESKGIDYKTMNVIMAIEEQSPDIAQCLHIDQSPEDLGAGDQGLMVGYATDETPELMPLSHSLATSLGKRLTEVRRDGTMPYLRPDGKTQVTVEYSTDSNGHLVAHRVHTIVISTQHHPDVSNEQLRSDLVLYVVKTTVPSKYLDDETVYHMNPSGRFVVGGPHGDAGLTGRKIIIDTYGGWGAHGGGAFSGKDCSKVDRSAAYAARWAAKSLVSNGFCRRCVVQVAYSIGISHPLSLYINTYNTVADGYTDSDLEQIVSDNFDFRPGCIIRDLNLRDPIFKKTAVYGHFGRCEKEFPWEDPKDLSASKKTTL